jgi:hypothetical protein
MADTLYTLADLLKINDKNARDLGMSDILRDAPLLKALHTVPASAGTQHKYIKETTAPSVGFRAPNSGIARTPSGDTVVTVDLKYMDGSHIVDVATADAYIGGAQGFIARKLPRNIGQSLFTFEQQLINGGGSGFDGFKQALNALSNAMVVNATGTTVGGATSVYAVRSTPDELDVAAVIGNDGVISVKETGTQFLADVSGNTYAAYVTPIGSWLTVQVGSAYSLGRICNLTTQAGKGLTDILIASLINKFPAGRGPTHLVMNRQSLGQLQASRTAVNSSGAPAPFPTESHGVPIIVTDAIVNTEALVA